MGVNVKTDNLADFTLTVGNFPAFYKRIVAMRFPISVEEVLELRDLINQSLEVFEQPADNPQSREFKDSLLTAIHSFGIENDRHCKRLLNILAMLRDLHYRHSIDSRNTDERLRRELTANRQARSRSARYGLISLFATVVCGIAWIGVSEAALWLKGLTAGFAFFAWDYHHSLPALDKEIAGLTSQLNDVLRNRVEALNWKTLIHKISLVLGYKQIRGVEVFRHNTEHETFDGTRTYH
jgi:hypothetical protein